MRYDIAGLIVDLYPDFSNEIVGFEPFSSDIAITPDAKVYFEGCFKIEKPEGTLLFDEATKWYSCNREKNIYAACIHGVKDKNEILCRFDIHNWSEISVKYVNDIAGIENAVIKALGQILFRNLITLYNGVLLHASAIMWNEMGILFSAPSGTGKSTHASLWELYYDAKVINDDAPALKFSNDSLFVYGTPWSGSNEKHLPINAPVKAIFILEQHTNNEIQKLAINEAISRLLPRFFLPYYDDNLLERAINICGQIFETTPVYLLKCKPDREAAELVHQHITLTGGIS